jgi:hypothetical protein
MFVICTVSQFDICLSSVLYHSSTCLSPVLYHSLADVCHLYCITVWQMFVICTVSQFDRCLSSVLYHGSTDVCHLYCITVRQIFVICAVSQFDRGLSSVLYHGLTDVCHLYCITVRQMFVICTVSQFDRFLITSKLSSTNLMVGKVQSPRCSCLNTETRIRGMKVNFNASLPLLQVMSARFHTGRLTLVPLVRRLGAPESFWT